MQLLRSRVAWDSSNLTVAESAAREALAIARTTNDVVMQSRCVLLCVRVLIATRKHDEAGALLMIPVDTSSSDVAETFIALAKAAIFISQVWGKRSGFSFVCLCFYVCADAIRCAGKLVCRGSRHSQRGLCD